MTRLLIAQQFIEQAESVQEKPELLRLLEAVTRELGFRYFALIHHADLRQAEAHLIHFENYPESWADYFIENALYADDPVLRASLTSNIGFKWTEVPKMIQVNAQQRVILESASKQGMGEGFTIPANIPGERSGSCSFATRFGLRLPEESLIAAQLIGGFAFDAARRLSQNGMIVPPRPPKLTPRQKECVVLVGQGKTDWAISRILGLSEETVSQHITMARERYGVATRTQLVVRAVAEGEISFDEISPRQFPLKRE